MIIQTVNDFMLKKDQLLNFSYESVNL